MPKQKLIEVCRSFSFKYNAGDYQMADFFCSEKEEVPVGEGKATSRRLFDFCKSEVENDVATFIKIEEAKKTINIDDVGNEIKEKVVQIEPVSNFKPGEDWKDKKQLEEDEIKIEKINDEISRTAPF